MTLFWPASHCNDNKRLRNSTSRRHHYKLLYSLKKHSLEQIQRQISVSMQIPLAFADVSGTQRCEWIPDGGVEEQTPPTQSHTRPHEKPHQFQHRQAPSHRLGSHNAVGSYLHPQEEGSLICAGWKHSHHVMDKINCCPPQSMRPPRSLLPESRCNWSSPCCGMVAWPGWRPVISGQVPTARNSGSRWSRIRLTWMLLK